MTKLSRTSFNAIATSVHHTNRENERRNIERDTTSDERFKHDDEKLHRGVLER